MKLINHMVAIIGLIIVFPMIAYSSDESPPKPLKLALDRSWSVYEAENITEFKEFTEIESAKSEELISLIKRRVFESSDTKDPLWQ